jgi:hypothetical protein
VKWGDDRLDKLKEGRDRATAERQRLVERLKARAKRSPSAPASAGPKPETPEPRRMHALDVDAALAALLMAVRIAVGEMLG